MLEAIHTKKGLQLCLGLLIGISFGFLLQKGGVTRYDVIIGQLLLQDFKVVKIMLSAVITGMIGVHLLKSLKMARLHLKSGSLGQNVIGGLIFGIGFSLLGYCPGTVAGAAGQGSLDAIFGGIVGMLIGAGIFAAIFPKLQKRILKIGYFGELSLPQLLKIDEWLVIMIVCAAIVALLFTIEKAGL
ncbi:MAG: YeeE/YedE thiosulfate transporter family protein [Sedimentisphaerales bacterium]